MRSDAAEAMPVSSVEADFDRIARTLERYEPDPLEPFELALLDHLPQSISNALEVGCGNGSFTRELAHRADRVLAVDLSAEMIRIAEARSAEHPNIEFRVGDIATMELPEAAFDVVACIATLHHLPLDEPLKRLTRALRAGGVLLVQDIADRRNPRHLIGNMLAATMRAWRNLRDGRPARRRQDVRALYAQHGASERYLTAAEAERAFAELLPGAVVMHHLEWRYSAVWRKPASCA